MAHVVFLKDPGSNPVIGIFNEDEVFGQWLWQSWHNFRRWRTQVQIPSSCHSNWLMLTLVNKKKFRKRGRKWPIFRKIPPNERCRFLSQLDRCCNKLDILNRNVVKHEKLIRVIYFSLAHTRARMPISVTSKKLPIVYKRCPKMISLENFWHLYKNCLRMWEIWAN